MRGQPPTLPVIELKKIGDACAGMPLEQSPQFCSTRSPRLTVNADDELEESWKQHSLM
jgi:hypothetical protein